MKIRVKNLSKKPRSKRQYKLLKDWAVFIALELNVYHHIDELRITYKNDWPYNYYPAGKPMGGFKKLYNNRIATIDLTDFWDEDMECRKGAIVHELTHLKQMVEGRLVPSSDYKSVKWNGKTSSKWKTFRTEFYDGLRSNKLARQYLTHHLPWEAEVQANLDKYVRGRQV